MDDNWRNRWKVKQHRHMCLILLPLWLLATLDLASAGNKARGIDPRDLTYFQDDVIWCKDGSKSFPREQLNDNFCDCADGTDEPGTSACPRSKYYCKNAGSTPKLVFASQVNDGLCDCCDGSDEYERRVICANSCGNVASKEVDKNSVAGIVDSNEKSSYDDSGMLIDQQQYQAGFWEAGSKDFISKLKDMRLLLGLQLLALFCLLCWQCVMWLRVFRRRLKLRRSSFQLSSV